MSKNSWRGRITAAILGVCGLAIAGLARAAPPSMALELPLLDGTRFVRLADFSGRPVLLNFWGSECPPCVREIPLLVSASRRYSAVQFLGIAVDDRINAIRFLERMPPGYPQVIAPRSPEVLLRRFGNKLGALPYTVVLNSRHQMCVNHLGEVDAAWIAAAILYCGTMDKSAPESTEAPR